MTNMNMNTHTDHERRQSARHKIRLEVNLVLADGTLLPVESINISDSGLQVSCAGWAVNEIEPRGIQTHSTSHIKLKAIIDLPGLHGTKKLYALCKIISAQRLSQEKYHLNLQFTSFENGSEVALDNFLSQFHQTKIVINALA